MDLESLFNELNSNKPQAPKPEVSLLEEPTPEVKPKPKKEDVKHDTDDLVKLKKVPSRRRVHCGICKKMLKTGEDGWYLSCEKDEYWWCTKCSK